MRRFLRLLDPLFQSPAAHRLVVFVVRLWSSSAARLAPDEGLRRLLRLDDLLQERIDWLAIELDEGIHAKHRLISYHDFFVGRVSAGDRVLDVGCGKGELAYDLATRAGARVTGVDFSRSVLAFASERFHAEALAFVEGDVLAWNPPHDFDVIVLSNVLEHIAPRVELLRRLRTTARPKRFLIRVPSRERHWLVPLREELGLTHFSDPTHETEYTVPQLHEELREAGLEIDELEQRWGEIWAAARPAGSPEARAILGR
jgi:2-polyprenyl-3-methyl-5-hydroxy-6-metoxy-1,4-benzoquinol methylase